jgi:hypothetical protein
MNRRRQTRIAEEVAPSETPPPVARPSSPESPVTDSPAGQAHAVHDFLQRLSVFVAPPTLVIALAYWFGWTLTNARSRYFGIDSSTLGYSTTDYLLRSADTAFVPVAVILLAIFAAISLHGLIQHAAVTHRGLAAVRRGAAARGNYKSALSIAADSGQILSSGTLLAGSAGPPSITDHSLSAPASQLAPADSSSSAPAGNSSP